MHHKFPHGSHEPTKDTQLAKNLSRKWKSGRDLNSPLSPTQPANAPPSFLPPTRAMKMEWKMPGGNNNSSQASQVEAVFPSVSHPAPHPSHPLSTLHHPSHSPTPASFRLMALLIDAARNLLKIKRTETKREGGTSRIVWAATIAVVFPF